MLDVWSFRMLGKLVLFKVINQFEIDRFIQIYLVFVNWKIINLFFLFYILQLLQIRLWWNNFQSYVYIVQNRIDYYINQCCILFWEGIIKFIFLLIYEVFIFMFECWVIGDKIYLFLQVCIQQQCIFIFWYCCVMIFLVSL